MIKGKLSRVVGQFGRGAEIVREGLSNVCVCARMMRRFQVEAIAGTKSPDLLVN